MVAKAVRISWPEEPGPAPRSDWKETLTAATEIALCGFCVVAAALPIVTLGAALATGSFAVRHWVLERRLPPWAEIWRLGLRWLLPGVGATALIAVFAAMMFIDLNAVARGDVPGGTAVLVATVVVVALAATIVALCLVHLGRWPADGWWAAARWAATVTFTAPHRAVPQVAICVFAGLLGAMIPATIPLLVGYALFAMHVVADKLLPEPLPPEERAESD